MNKQDLIQKAKELEAINFKRPFLNFERMTVERIQEFITLYDAPVITESKDQRLTDSFDKWMTLELNENDLERIENELQVSFKNHKGETFIIQKGGN